MPNETSDIAADVVLILRKALDLLSKNELGGFLEQMAALGKRLEQHEEIHEAYKNRKQDPDPTTWQASLPKSKTAFSRDSQQALYFEILQNAWEDHSLVRMKDFVLVTLNTPPEAKPKAKPNTCQILELDKEPFWEIIPFDEKGEQQAAINPKTWQADDDIAELLKQQKAGKDVDHERLKRALKRANFAALDQRSYSVNAALSKEVRHRIRLGMQAFEALCPEKKTPPSRSSTPPETPEKISPASSIETLDDHSTLIPPTETPSDHTNSEEKSKKETSLLACEFVEDEPTAAQLNSCSPNTYVVLTPREGRKGRVWFIDSRRKKREITSSALRNKLQKLTDNKLPSIHNKELQKLLDEQQFSFGVRNKQFSLSPKIVTTLPTDTELNALESNTYFLLTPSDGGEQTLWYFDREVKEKNQRLKKQLDIKQNFLSDTSFHDNAQKKFDDKIRLFLLNEHFRWLDEKAAHAIRGYKTRKQKVLSIFESTVAFLASFSYGTVSASSALIGLFLTAGIIWTNPWLAILGAIILASAVLLPLPGTWINWKLFSTYVGDFFRKIGPEYREINSPKKKALFWLLALLALATGMATGGMIYTATIALPGMLGLSSIGFIFPPIAVILAAAVVFCQFVTFTRSFCNYLRKENSWKSFKKPFIEVGQYLRKSNASKGRRIATWTLVSLLCVLTGLGLVMSCFTGTRSVGKFFIDQFMLTPDRAIYLGVMISAVASFLSRISFTLGNAFTFSKDVSIRVFRTDPHKFFHKEAKKNPKQPRREIKIIPRTIDPKKAEEELKAEIQACKPNTTVIFLTQPPQDDSTQQESKEKDLTTLRTTYFVKNNQLVLTEQGVLKTKVKLSIQEQCALEMADKPKGDDLIINKGSRRITFTRTPDEVKESLIQKTLAQASDKMLAKENRPPPYSLEKTILVAIDSGLAGAFYGQGLDAASKRIDLTNDIPTGFEGANAATTAAVAVPAFLVSGVRSEVIGMKHAGEPESAASIAGRTTAQIRTGEGLTFFRSRNKDCKFAKEAAPLMCRQDQKLDEYLKSYEGIDRAGYLKKVEEKKARNHSNGA